MPYNDDPTWVPQGDPNRAFWTTGDAEYERELAEAVEVLRAGTEEMNRRNGQRTGGAR